mmetsp:Transcript_6139/g.12444  ORF Transcript_6139/g.12444 Transcript_6139/m.12444 type:complete len:125 (-) Transcript_6139:19-393(-)
MHIFDSWNAIQIATAVTFFATADITGVRNKRINGMKSWIQGRITQGWGQHQDCHPGDGGNNENTSIKKMAHSETSKPYMVGAKECEPVVQHGEDGVLMHGCTVQELQQKQTKENNLLIYSSITC